MARHTSIRHRGTFLLLVFAGMVLVGAAPIAAQEATPTTEVTILSPDEEYEGLSLGEWDAQWWQWALSFPLDAAPSDPEVGDCAAGQHGPVFFLPANFTGEPLTHDCVVPAGKAVFFLIIGSECSTVEPPPFFGSDEEELRACAEATTDQFTGISASINGEAVTDVDQYRVSSPLVSMTFPEDNIFDVPPGVASFVAADYVLLLAPLPEGEHEFAVRGAVEAQGLNFDTTYRVSVEAPQVVEPEATPDTGTPAATPAT